MLIVRQFTLAASARSGSRPLCQRSARRSGLAALRRIRQPRPRRAPGIATGRFGAEMQMHCCNGALVAIALPMN